MRLNFVKQSVKYIFKKLCQEDNSCFEKIMFSFGYRKHSLFTKDLFQYSLTDNIVLREMFLKDMAFLRQNVAFKDNMILKEMFLHNITLLSKNKPTVFEKCLKWFYCLSWLFGAIAVGLFIFFSKSPRMPASVNNNCKDLSQVKLYIKK